VGVFRDLVQLIMVLPGAKAGDFRLKAANYLCRLLAGDASLIPQILATQQAVAPELREAIMTQVPTALPEPSPVEKRCREGHLLLDLEERNFNFQAKRIKFMQDMFGPFDERDRLYYKDLVKKCGDSGYAAIQDTEDERGREISIALVCQEIGVNPRGTSPQIGRRVAQLWRERYPGETPAKRDTLYQGRPYKENTYYQRDYDLLEKAIKEIVK
jgi:hypothetical protein